MRHGEPLKYWTWAATLRSAPAPLLELKGAVMPFGVWVLYSVKDRKFLEGLDPLCRRPISTDRIDQRAVAEALAVSLTYEEGS